MSLIINEEKDRWYQKYLAENYEILKAIQLGAYPRTFLEHLKYWQQNMKAWFFKDSFIQVQNNILEADYYFQHNQIELGRQKLKSITLDIIKSLSILEAKKLIQTLKQYYRQVLPEDSVYEVKD